jgi:hypothetical protein
LTFSTGALALLLSVLMLAVPATTWPLVGSAVAAGAVSAKTVKLTHSSIALIISISALLSVVVRVRGIRS